MERKQSGSLNILKNINAQNDVAINIIICNSIIGNIIRKIQGVKVIPIKLEEGKIIFGKKVN